MGKDRRKKEEEEDGSGRICRFFSCLFRAEPTCSPGQDCLYAHIHMYARVCVCGCVCVCVGACVCVGVGVGVTVWCQRWGDGLWLLLRDGILMLLCL